MPPVLLADVIVHVALNGPAAPGSLYALKMCGV